jgi:hypothetical protein
MGTCHLPVSQVAHCRHSSQISRNLLESIIARTILSRQRIFPTTHAGTRKVVKKDERQAEYCEAMRTGVMDQNGHG